MVRRSAREATLAPGRGFGPLPLLPLPFPSLVKVGAAALVVLCCAGVPSASPHPTPGSPPLLGAQNMQLLRHPSPHYPITFTPFILPPFPENKEARKNQ